MRIPLWKRILNLCLALVVIPAASQVSATRLYAEVSLPNIFGNHMVLQQKQKNKVWGRAAANEKVTVKIGDQAHDATADQDGNWSVMLDPLNVGGPLELTIQASNTLTISDVLVGEVWICSGQSNMEWSVSNTYDADLAMAAANFPKIRMINYPNVGTQQPIWTHDTAWNVCSPQTVGGFSAVGYFFGKQLFETIDVPIGLINNSWGGSAADSWVSREILEANQDYKPTLDRWRDVEQKFEAISAKAEPSEEDKKQRENLRRQLDGNQRPGNLYNGILKSHLGYGIRGAIWYQGESNAGRAYQYRYLFPLMIDSWRKEWGQGDFPFYWVQLADFRDEKPEPAESDWAELREAQTMTMSKLANTGEAVIIDIGEGKDIHPRNKVIVGQRLARWALAKEYGLQLAHQSPTYSSMEKKDGKIILTFDHVDGGWRPFDVNQVIGFAVAGADQKFFWADARILDKNRIEVSSVFVNEPVAARYGWADNPACNMFNGIGLPLTPFRTDDWPGVTVNNN